MDLYATFACPIQVVFGHLADPSRLGEWLCEVAVTAGAPSSPGGAGAQFSLTAQAEGAQVTASGEMSAFEPPWLVGYRLFIGPRVYGLRVT